MTLFITKTHRSTGDKPVTGWGPSHSCHTLAMLTKKQNQSKLKMRKTYGVHLQRKRQNNSEWSRQTVKPIRNDRLLRAVEVWSFVKKKIIQQSTSILKQLDQTHLIVVNFSIHRPHLRQYNSFIPCVASSLTNVNGAVIWRKRQLYQIKKKVSVFFIQTRSYQPLYNPYR